jgi:inhibitor of KinA sporulation pathway (predicted exonuclease)
VKEVLIFDTEFTAWAGSMARNWRGPGEFKEIVQIGAITLGAQDMNETGSFSVLIRPVKNPVLSSYFEKLTRITNQQLESDGLTFAEGIRRFLGFAGGRPSFCYGRDDRIIAENAALLGMQDQWTFEPSVNLRLWLERVGVPLAGVHSGELAAHVGAVSQGRAHDALTDARSLAEAVRYLVRKGAPNPFL